MGDGQVTGLITGIERETLDQVRQDCTAAGDALRNAADRVESQLLPLVDDAAITDWVSSGRLTYDLSRAAVTTALGIVRDGFRGVAAHYDDAIWLIDQQSKVEFP
ncbi:hypothetical protein [Gulosibacter molinativorax]|nr:hypothetical protein [Gulosibacter molinativorax]